MTDMTNMTNWFSKTSKFVSQQVSKVSGHKLKTILFPEYALQVTRPFHVRRAIARAHLHTRLKPFRRAYHRTPEPLVHNIFFIFPSLSKFIQV